MTKRNKQLLVASLSVIVAIFAIKMSIDVYQTKMLAKQKAEIVEKQVKTLSHSDFSSAVIQANIAHNDFYYAEPTKDEKEVPFLAKEVERIKKEWKKNNRTDHLVFVQYQTEPIRPQIETVRNKEVIYQPKKKAYVKTEKESKQTHYIDSKTGEELSFSTLLKQDEENNEEVRRVLNAVFDDEKISDKEREMVLAQALDEKISSLSAETITFQSADQTDIQIPIKKIFPYFKEEYLTADEKKVLQEREKQAEKARKENRIAITFDDGPHAVQTPRLLDILKKHHVKATFFVLGENVRGNEKIVKRIVKEGHQIANHSYDHPQLTKLSPNQINQEIEKTSRLIHDASGVWPTTVRPPYGALNGTVRKELKNYKTVLWTVDSLDWKTRDAAKVQQKILKQVRKNSVILMHDIHPTTVDAVDGLLTALEKQYSFVTVDEMSS